MAIVFDRDFGRVWSDGTTPCVFCSVVRVPTKNELDELALKQLAMIGELKRTFADVYSILDLRHCPPVSAQTAQYYVHEVLPKQFKAGLKHKAFVEPEEKKSKEILVQTLRMRNDLAISLHSSFESALNAINEIRTHSHKGNSILDWLRKS